MKLPALATATAVLVCLTGTTWAQDLTVRIMDCPRSAKAGQELTGTFRIQVKNDGKSAVKNAKVDVVLKKDAICPPVGRPAVYAPDFFDGVLLREGRHFVSLEPGETSTFKPYGANAIPLDTPVGRNYFLCAVVTSGAVEPKGDEPGTCACSPIKIVGTETRPVIRGFSQPCGNKGGTVTLLGSDFGSGAGKTVMLSVDGMNVDLPVISWGESAITVRVPDDARIKDGKSYQVGIRKSDQAELLSNWKQVSICAIRRTPDRPVSAPPPITPFFFQ